MRGGVAGRGAVSFACGSRGSAQTAIQLAHVLGARVFVDRRVRGQAGRRAGKLGPQIAVQLQQADFRRGREAKAGG